MAVDGGGRPRVVILGGGAGGLQLAAKLGKRSDMDVILVDREMSHLWKPRLHEFAAGTVSSSLAEVSFYLVGRMRSFHFEQGEVARIDREARTVELAPIRDPDGRELAAARRVPYDICVVALGGVTPDFGVEGVAENAVRLDGPEDAERFRSRFVAAMIGARESGVPAEVVIVGSGATGTELAAHLRRSERGFFEPDEAAGTGSRHGKFLGITILEAAPEIMPGADADLRGKLLERLRELDVKVVTDARIAAVDADAIRSESGERWPSDVSVWATGLVANPVLKRLADFELDDKGRIRTDRTLRSTVDERILVLGDSASVVGKGSDKPLPPTAQAASQEALYLAETMPFLVKGQPVEPFEYDNKGRLVSLGPAGVVGTIGGRRGDDILIHGQFAAAAYHALQRQHQWRVLGPLSGSLAIAADMLSPAKGPALKLHG